jgi:PAS domain S-box-containing protein
MGSDRELESNLDHLRSKLQRQELRPPARDERLRGMGFFEAMVKSLPEAVAVLQGGVHVHCNEAWAWLFGFATPAELAGKAFEELLEPADTGKVGPHLRVQPERPVRIWSIEAKGRARSGQVLELELTGRAFLQGGTAYMSLSARDLRIAKRAEEALRRNEWWWRHMFHMSLVGMAMISVEGRLVAANDRLCGLLGYSREDLLQKTWVGLTPAEDVPAELELFQGLLQGRGLGAPYEKKVVGADGGVIAVLVNASAIFRPDGRPEQVLALVQDLTEQREVQGRLSATEDVARLLGAAVEQSPVSIVITDKDAVIQYVNPKFVEITGYSAEEAKGQNPRILKSGLHDPEFYAAMWRTLVAGRTWSGQLANRRKDGSIFWEKVLISPVFSKGETTHYFAVKEDITRSREMEQSQRRLLSALEFATDAIAISSLEGEKIYANRSFQSLLGCTCAECPNPDLPAEECKFKRFLAGVLEDLFRRIRAGLMKAGEGWREQVTWERNKGEKPIVLAVSASLLAAPQESVWDLLLVCRDVTQELELENHLRHVEKMDALGTMVSGITHDFNNVLTAIQSAAELIEWQLPEDSPARSKLSVILQASGRARELNRQILAFSRPDQEQKIPFDLSAVIKECVHLLKNAIPKDISLRTAITSSLWVTGDPAQIHQVLMNLSMNAVHAMEGKPGELEITLTEVADPRPEESVPGALLSVRDNGCGMDEETLKRACEPFFSTREPGKGTGLGLSVVPCASIPGRAGAP